MSGTADRTKGAVTGRLLIVVNDLLVYGTAATQPTGIQRLADGYARHLPSVAAERGIEVVTVVVAPGVVREVELLQTSTRGRRIARSAELALRVSAHLPRPVQERARTVSRRLLARRATGAGHPVVTRPEDTLLVVGAPWIAPGMAAI